MTNGRTSRVSAIGLTIAFAIFFTLLFTAEAFFMWRHGVFN
jgi:hypothetical protein